MKIERKRERPSRLGATCRPALLLILAMAFVASLAGGQTNDEVHAGQQFSFAPPGARSMAMGGAFSGLADDATAAFANPAGLLWLRKPEVSIELRRTDLRTRYPDRGSASGSPALCGNDPAPGCTDILPHLQFGESSTTVDDLAFLSYVHLFAHPASNDEDEAPPLRQRRYREEWRLALFRHQLANYKSRIHSEGPFLGGPGTRRGTRSRLAAQDAEYDLLVVTTGLSVARELASSGRLRLWSGLTLGWSTVDLDSRSSRYRTILPTQGNTARTGPADFSSSNETNRQNQTGDDGAASWSAGLILRSEDANWSLGAVYRQAPEFDIDYRFAWGEEARERAIDSGNPDAADPGIEAALTGTAVLQIPDTWSVGGSIRIRERFRASLDYTRVRYSLLRPVSNVLLNLISTPDCGEFDRGGTALVPPVTCRVNPGRLSRFVIDDGDEVHLGFELVAGRRSKVALRLGGWLDPDHQLRFDVDDQLGNGLGDSAIANSTPPLDRLATRFLPGQDEVHVTGGLGIIPSREGLQIDLAADVSDRAEILSLSMVYRW